MTSTQASNTSTGWLLNFMMGGLAASISKTCAAPIERVKMLLQVRPEQYRGITATFKKVYHEEGFVSFWRGNGTNVIRYFPTQALNFAFKDYFRTIFGGNKNDPFARRLAGNIASGAAAGATGSEYHVLLLSEAYDVWVCSSTLSIMPEHVSRSTQRLLLVEGRDSSMVFLMSSKLLFCITARVHVCSKQTLKSNGVLGLYTGFNASVVGIMFYRGTAFGLYDSVMPLLPGEWRGNAGAKFAVGYCSTVAGSLVSYPFDTVRRRMMMTVGGSGPDGQRYKNTLDAFRQLIAKEGAAAMFRGCGANILRSVAGGGALTLYDVFQEKAFGTVYKSGSG